MTPEEIAAAFGLELTESTALESARTCEWCGTHKTLTWRVDHFTCELCWQGGGGEYDDELTMRVSRHLERRAFSNLPRDRDGRPILPALTNKAWRKLHH